MNEPLTIRSAPARSASACFAVLAAAAAAVSVEAQPAAAPAPESQAVVMDRFAQCVGSRWRRSMVRVLQEVPGSVNERTRLSGAIADWGFCIDPLSSEHTRLVFQPDAIRGPFAEYLYEHDFAGVGQPRGEAVARLPDPVEIIRRRNLPEAVQRAAIVGIFATCVVQRRPAEAAAVLATAPSSRAEARAVHALAPEFGNCFPAGSQFDITVSFLRGYLAAALYRHSAALAAAPAGPTE